MTCEWAKALRTLGGKARKNTSPGRVHMLRRFELLVLGKYINMIIEYFGP